ncbi:MAG: Mrp/NBP35 family ATP-binding protein [Candidatus Jordarchaeum sp.]|uniref:Mrp/NBP35 family ATP-binding protein n=1 Tax=Candidatus Jordarchaeum sp. TaxID=2823881 RepID=UPI004048FBD9
MTNKENSAEEVIEQKIKPMIEKIAQKKKVQEKMTKVKHQIMIMSGKGGVGKSTVTANLATALAKKGKKVGILDSDIHGPSIPKILGIQGKKPKATETGIQPVTTPQGVKVISMDLLVTESEKPLIWRGPLKMKAIRQLLSEVDWGQLDYLLIDLPPGTGDEPLNIMQLMPEMDGAIIITAPSDLSQYVVRKAVSMAQKMKIPVIGIIENMSGFVCPNCGERYEILGSGGGKKISKEMNLPLLGQIPIDPEITVDSDQGTPFIVKNPETQATKIFEEIVQKIQKTIESGNKQN